MQLREHARLRESLDARANHKRLPVKHVTSLSENGQVQQAMQSQPLPMAKYGIDGACFQKKRRQDRL